jgi:hypothetical protein
VAFASVEVIHALWAQRCEQGQRDMLARCITAVNGLYLDEADGDWNAALSAAESALVDLQDLRALLDGAS